MPNRKSERKLKEQRRRSERLVVVPTAARARNRPQRPSFIPYWRRNPDLVQDIAALLPTVAAFGYSAGVGSAASEELPTTTTAASHTAPGANMAEQMFDPREARIDAKIDQLTAKLATIERKIEQAETKRDNSTGEAQQHAIADLADLRADKSTINAQLVKLEGQKEALLNAGPKRKVEERLDDLQQELQQLKRARPSHLSTNFEEQVASAVRNARDAPPFGRGSRRYIVVNLTDANIPVDLTDGTRLTVPPLSEQERNDAAAAIQALPQDKKVFIIGADVFGSETKVVQPLATLVFSCLFEQLIPECTRYLCVDTHKPGKCYLWKRDAPDGVVFTIEVTITGPTRQHLNSSNVAVVFEWKGSETLDDHASLPQLIKYLFSFLKASPQRRFVYGLLSDLHHGILVKAWRTQTTQGEDLDYQIYTRVSGPELVGLIQALLTANPADLDATPLTMRKTETQEEMHVCLGNTLGHGASGDVCVGISAPQGERFAIKGLGASTVGQAHIDAELAVLDALSNSKLLDGQWVSLEAEEWQLNGRRVLKLPLFRPSCPSLWRRNHVPGVIAALRAIHAAGYIHRDVRPSNFVFAHDRDGQLIPLIIDFGCAIPNDGLPRHYSGSKAYASFRFLNDEDGSLNKHTVFEFRANDDLFSLVLSMFSIFMTADGCIEGQPLFSHVGPGATPPSYRKFWETRLPPCWVDLIDGLMRWVGAAEPGAYERVQGFLEGNLPELPLFAHDLNDADDA